MKLKLTQQFWFYVFIVLNCFLGVTSFILFVLSIKAQDHLFQYKLIIQYTIPAIYPTGIFTGCLGLVTTCLGFLGIWRKINIFYILHVICLTIETIINLCIAVVSVIIDDQFFINAKEALNTTIKYYYEKNEYGDEFDKLHMTFFCCGVNSYADFRKAKLLIPYSCRVGQFVYARGCYDELSDFVQYYITLLTSICFITSFIYIVFIGVSILNLHKSIKGKNPSSS